MADIPEDIRLLAELLARRHEERQFTVGGQTTKAIADDTALAILAERERCARIAREEAAHPFVAVRILSSDPSTPTPKGQADERVRTAQEALHMALRG